MAKILVVEDDKFLRELILRKLKEENYETCFAVDGEEGLNKIQEERPDLVLLDLILPGMNGFDVLKKKQEMPEIAQIPVVVLSNLGQKEDVERALKYGAKDYLVKAHFTLDEIAAKIKKYLPQS
jgi:CheY-like chemotaxis protein